MESVVPDVLCQDEAFWTLLLSVPQASTACTNLRSV